MIEVKVGPGDVVAPGSALATIARNDRSGETIALLYVPAGEGRRIQPGMRAELLPDTVEREVHGTIVGRVLSVSPLPATREGMRRILRTTSSSTSCCSAAPSPRCRWRSSAIRATPTGLRWSTSRGPEGGVGIGTLTGARIVIDRRRVLDWLLPGSG